jgi:hypothetical protein
MRWLVLVSVVGVAGAPLAAQGGRPLGVSGQRDLSFGTVLPGVPRIVLRTDPVNSGMFEITGQRFSLVQLTFILPPVMLGPSGATMPLAFGAGTAGFSFSGAITSQFGFNPAQQFIGILNNTGRASVFLGGTASPGAGQPAGSYAGSVTLTVAYLGA